MSKTNFALMMLLLVALAAFTATAHDGYDHDHEDDEPVVPSPDVPHVHITEDDLDIDDSQIPHISREELDNDVDHTELIAFCKDLKSKFLPLVKHRFDAGIEAHIMSDAANLGKYLEDARHKHLQKDHEHFTCEEAQDIVKHSTAVKFMETYTKFATQAGPDNLSNDAAIVKFQELHDALKASHLVNKEALDHVTDAIEDLTHLGKWYKNIKASFDHVMKKQTGCEKDYQDYIKEMHDISTDKMPDWEHIHMGVASLVRQCEEDDDLRSEL